MQLKLDESGHAVVVEGKPVYIHDDGKEIPFDAAAAVAQIHSRTQQNQRVEAENKALKERAALFEGIDDPSAALKALETVKNLSDKKLVDAGDVDKVKAEAVKAFEEKLIALEKKYEPVLAERDQFKDALVKERIGGAFSRSKLIADKLAIPADMVEARFGDRFKLEGDAIVAYDGTGNRIFSRAKPGEIAAFDEALDILIESYPHRDHILKGANASGNGGLGGKGRGDKTMTRDQFLALGPHERATRMAEGFKVVEP